MDQKAQDIDHLCMSLKLHHDRPEIVAAILQQPDFNVTLALRREAQYGGEHVAKILIKAGADVNYQDRGGLSALIKGCHMGHVEFGLQILEAEGVQVNLQDNEGFSALHGAVNSLIKGNRGALRLIKKLSAMGANPHLRNKMGESPADLAATDGWTIELFNTFTTPIPA